MIQLGTTSSLVQLVTSAAVNVGVHASFFDIDQTSSAATDPAPINTLISTATTTTIVTSPGAGLNRKIKALTINNQNAVNPCTVTVQHTDGTTAINVFGPVVLQAGWTFAFIEGRGFVVYDASGHELTAGATGATGAQGPGVFVMGEPGEDGVSIPMIPPSGRWEFLGSVTGATTTVGPIIWTGGYQHLYFAYNIAGYNGATPVGRVQFGSASISTTAANNGNVLAENGVFNATSVSVPGCPLAVTLSAIARNGWGYVDGVSGALKQVTIRGLEGTPSAAASPVQFDGGSWFSDLGTNLLLQRAQLSVYDTLVATSLSAQAFLAGTALAVWGRRES